MPGDSQAGDHLYDGYLTAEQIAVANNRSVANIRSIARRLALPTIIPPGRKHRHYSPDAVERIQAEIARTRR